MTVIPRPTVSIITPNYNGSRFLRQAIESVSAQTFSDWEMLIVDDGSTDDSERIIKEYAALDRRIKFLKTDIVKFPKRILSPAAARNTAIDSAQGRYIAFLDSDDLWYETKLEKQIAFFCENDCALVYTWYDVISEVGNIVGRHVPSPNMQSYKDLLKDCKIGCSSTMYDTAKIGKQLIDINDQGADYSLWLKITKTGHNAYCLKEKLSAYRLVRNSISANKFKMAKEQWQVLRKIEKLTYPFALYNFSFYALRGIKKNLRYMFLRFF